ncbi:hypothetical protein CQ10_40640 [Bradyrhizobium valentinum]|nr:hypothetical protein CQ10_40640 [Bradyrhizobium valentinum]
MVFQRTVKSLFWKPEAVVLTWKRGFRALPKRKGKVWLFGRGRPARTCQFMSAIAASGVAKNSF